MTLASSFCDVPRTSTRNRGHWLFPSDSLGGALGTGSVRPKNREDDYDGKGSGLGQHQLHFTYGHHDKWAGGDRVGRRYPQAASTGQRIPSGP